MSRENEQSKCKFPVHFDNNTMVTSTEDNSNCIVAESDYQAALKAIESSFLTALEENNDPITRKMMEATHASLVQGLTRIVQPVSDQSYHDVVDPYHIVMDDDEVDDDSDDEHGEIEGEDMFEFDDEELLDTKAYATAKDKREQVRTLSRHIQQIRQRVLDRVAEEASKPFAKDSSRVRIEPPSAEAEAILPSALKTSLEDLDKMLNDSKLGDISKQSKQLHDTMEVVQKEIDKDRPMSQTEIAIISRTNSSVDEELQEEYVRLSQPEQASNMGKEAITPSDRLAYFFQGFE